MPIRRAVKLADAPELHDVPKVPPCPKDGSPMRYDPEKNAWKCLTPGCKMIARPDTEIEGKPILGKGRVMFVVDHDPFRIWAKADNNVMVELTAFIDSDKMMLVPGGGISLHIELMNDDIINVADMAS